MDQSLLSSAGVQAEEASGANSYFEPTAPVAAGQPAQARVLHSARSSLRCAPPGDRRPRSQYGPGKNRCRSLHRLKT